MLCDELAAIEGSLAGPLISDEHLVAYHLVPNERFPRQYLGRVLIVTRRHVDHLSELNDEEVVAVGYAARRISAGLMGMDGVRRVHLALIGIHHPHFHLHLYPRYEWMPDEADWNSLQQRPDAPLGGEADIAAYAHALQALIPPAAA
jgi:diadenosine tetraphosphate (Ap4A) HIT family hydrolase